MVRIPSAYNAILGRSGLNALREIVSTYHLLVRFSTRYRVGELRGDQQLAKRCFSIASKQTKEQSPLESLDSREEEARGAPVEELEMHPLKEDDPTKTIQIGSMLPKDIKKKLLEFLRANSDVFAWTASEMPGIRPEVIVHHLNVNLEHKLV